MMMIILPDLKCNCNNTLHSLSMINSLASQVILSKSLNSFNMDMETKRIMNHNMGGSPGDLSEELVT